MEHHAQDFVVVGAGSAGCVVASRLSEDPRNTVTLIEAGGSDRRFWIRTPAGMAMTFADPRVNWCYQGQADPGMNGRSGYFPRGKVVGGSGSINAMAYVRGLPRDFDDWAEAGAAGWTWAEVKPAFDALESQVERGPSGRPQRRGTGPIVVSDLSATMHPFSRNFLAAARDLDWPVLDDLNIEASEGLGLLRSNVLAGRRWSTADACLRPALCRPNLRLVTQADVARIVLDGGRAVGVTYRRGGREVTARARREVILCAGAINSPKILQLSGIGEPDLLRSHGIDVAHAMAEVGRGLQDHLAVSHLYATDRPTLNALIGTPAGRLMAGIRYLLTRRGPLSIPVNQCSGFVRSEPDAPGPDVQVYCNPASYTTRPDGRTEIDREQGYLLSVQPCRPTSRGRVRIASSDPRDPPRIEPNALSTNDDCRQAIAASRVLQRLATAPTLAALTTCRRAPDIVGMDETALLENFRDRAKSVFHASCTCRMGADASISVVDSRLRLHGLAGLRVVDASAFPNVTSGNTNAPTIMLAARGADMILADNRG